MEIKISIEREIAIIKVSSIIRSTKSTIRSRATKIIMIIIKMNINLFSTLFI
jgi:hypothetical protein